MTFQPAIGFMLASLVLYTDLLRVNTREARELIATRAGPFLHNVGVFVHIWDHAIECRKKSEYSY
jgi:hypothetical protein